MNATNVRAEFRIMGDDFNVLEISEALAITPTMVWNAGDLIRGTGRKRTYTAWIFSTGTEETMDINSQLKKIEDIFSPKTDVLCRLKNSYNLEFSIDIVIIIENQSPPAIYLENPVVHFASGIGARFDIDTYVN